MVTEEVSESVTWSIIADTTPDVSHRDQLVVVARYVGQAQGIIASVDRKSLN